VTVSHSGPPAQFSFRSDRLCLDFAATLMFRATATPRELLDTPASFTAWAQASGVVSTAPACAAEALHEATTLREAIYRSCTTRIDRPQMTSADIAVLNRFGEHAPVLMTLTRNGTVTRSGAVRAVLATLARDAIELLGGPEAERLRQCRRNGCTRMFIDRSRGANRSWCGMRECGNRVNAAAYRHRLRQHSHG
jgi:predicted RNA-binding Zn ribbon-like protein